MHRSLLLWLVVFWTTSTPVLTAAAGPRCVPLRLPMCQHVGYNFTSVPNRFGHETQDDAGLEAHQFWPLITVKCYEHMKFFLCSMYAPICQENYDKMLPPCREVCLAAKKGCSPLMAQYGFTWPDALNCDQLPLQREQQETGVICAAPPDVPDVVDVDIGSAGGNRRPPIGGGDIRPPPGQTAFGGFVEMGRELGSCNCDCKAPFVPTPNDPKDDQRTISVGNVSQCSYPCHSPFLVGVSARSTAADEPTFLTTWLSIWSWSCFVLSLFTVLTFIIEMDRFQYPERPIFFMAFCQMMVSLGFILRLGYGHELIACAGARVRYQHYDDSSVLCTIVFVLIYGFGMAASVWWVVLALTWLLAAGFKWSSEAIASYSPWFHAFAWALPAVQSVAAVYFHAVDGDPVSGICYVGNTNVLALRALVLGPLIAYLTLGGFFLVAGFANLWRIRAVVRKQQGSGKASKLTRLISKIGVFSVLYTIPALTVIFAHFYEQHFRPLWEQQRNCPCAHGQPRHSSTYTLLAAIKLASMLIVGVTSGMWICSGKTLLSWKRVLCGLLHCHVPPPSSPAHYYQPADLIYVKSHTDVSSSQIYGSTVRHHRGGYGPMPEKV